MGRGFVQLAAPQRTLSIPRQTTAPACQKPTSSLESGCSLACIFPYPRVAYQPESLIRNDGAA